MTLVLEPVNVPGWTQKIKVMAAILHCQMSKDREVEIKRNKKRKQLYISTGMSSSEQQQMITPYCEKGEKYLQKFKKENGSPTVGGTSIRIPLFNSDNMRFVYDFISLLVQ